MKNSSYFITLVCLTPTLHADSNTLHNYIWANYQQFGNHTASAQQRYNLLFTEKSQSIYTRKGYLHFLSKTGQHNTIIEHTNLINSTFAHDPELQILLVHALQKNGKIAQAQEQLLTAYKTCPLDAQIVLEIAQLYVNNKELNNALTTIDTFLNAATKKQNYFIFYFIKAQIYVQLQKVELALESIKECLAMHSGFDKGWLIRAMLEEQLGQLEHAIEGYTTFLELTGGTNKIIATHLMQLAIRHKSAQQNKQVQLITENNFNKAMALFDAKHYKQALVQVDICLSTNPDDVNSKLLKIQILSNMQQFNHAVALLQSWIKQEPDNALWFQALHLLHHNGAPTETLLKTLQAIGRDCPNNVLVALYISDIQMRTGAKKEAVTTLSVVAPHVKDIQLRTKVLFHLGLLYFELGDYAAMRTALEQGKSLNTNFLPLLNLLAHYYATKGQDLKQAQELIRVVHAQDQHNPHYLDTKALILYKQKEYRQARTLLEQLHAAQPHDATIALHLAKTVQKLGDAQRAKIIAQRATPHAHSAYEKTRIAKFLGSNS